MDVAALDPSASNGGVLAGSHTMRPLFKPSLLLRAAVAVGLFFCAGSAPAQNSGRDSTEDGLRPTPVFASIERPGSWERAGARALRQAQGVLSCPRWPRRRHVFSRPELFHTEGFAMSRAPRISSSPSCSRMTNRTRRSVARSERSEDAQQPASPRRSCRWCRERRGSWRRSIVRDAPTDLRMTCARPT